jgi:subtilisin family serine protease
MKLTDMQAINYAVDVWHVDIISMSCGFTESSERIQRAIDHASAEKVLIVAAAGNDGATGGWCWPARENSVLGMTAAHGGGDKYGRNPTPRLDRQSFSILGCAVPGYRRAAESQTAVKVAGSGTSHATAVATAVAAITMQILRDCKQQIVEQSETGIDSYNRTERSLRTRAGMGAVFHQMVGANQERDGYQFVQPWTIVPKAVDRSMRPLFVAQSIVLWCGPTSPI